ncbi:hypothetical protein AB3T73_000252 [Klebsiella aerogenes]
MNNEIEQIAQQNDMSIEFVRWFFNEKKAACGEHWFLALGAMWEGWKAREGEVTALALTLEKSREASGCPADVDLQDWVKQLAAENVQVRERHRFIRALAVSILEHSGGRRDWRGAMEDASDLVKAVDEVYSNTPATDRIVAGIKADGQSEVIEWLDAEITAIDTMYRGDPSYEHDAYWMKSEVLDVVELARKAFSAQLREGADK